MVPSKSIENKDSVEPEDLSEQFKLLQQKYKIDKVIPESEMKLIVDISLDTNSPPSSSMINR
jgi:hypothetical protein